MALTIPGGAYLVINADGSERWVNANGEPLKKEQAAEAKRLHDEAQAQRDEDQRQAVMLEAQRDPVARALLSQQDEARQVRASAVPIKARGKQDEGAAS